MNRSLLLGLALGAALAGGLLVALDAGPQVVDAAPGDIVPTTPRADPTGPVLTEFCISSAPHARFVYRDGTGHTYEAVIRNGTSTGFNYATGVETRVSTPSLFTTVRTDLGITNARMTTAVGSVRTAGVIVAPGTIQ